ncbi:MAG: hypothetical protein MK171_11140, partial [Pirellulales bacterium]|nr:hypothetical protein [Pirellulales bacterium]
MASTINASATSDILKQESADSNRVGRKKRAKVARLSEMVSESRFWRGPTPPDVSAEDVKAEDSWKAWSRHLRRRSAPPTLLDLCDTTSSPLYWGLSASRIPRAAQQIVQLEGLGRRQPGKKRPRVEDVERSVAGWLELSPRLPQTLDFALETLAVAHGLPLLAELVGREFWWQLIDALWHVAQAAADWRSDAELPPEQGVSQQLLAGELPLTLAYLFPEMRPVYKLQAAAHEGLSEGFVELLNGRGLVHGQYLAYLRPLLATWTRCRVLGNKFKKGTWNRSAEEQFSELTTHALALSSPQGTPLLGWPEAAPWTADFLRAALHIANDTADISAARALLKKKITTELKGKQVHVVPETSENCEWAGVAYMRTEWHRRAPSVAIDYSTPDLGLEVWGESRRLIAGTWSWETTLGGKRLEPAGSWDEVCWFSDDDVDYLELSIDLADGARLERQILLAREEMFLLLADNVIGVSSGKMCHRYRLPLDGNIAFQGEPETREGLLHAARPVARVLPLALPEWRSDPRVGQLIASDGDLQLEQEWDGTNMACPLLIDLKNSRIKKPCTWRQLTVAEALEIQSSDVAVGYRAQCGRQQWLFYRSLAKAANRTVLGQNFSIECVVARFLAPAGDID